MHIAIFFKKVIPVLGFLGGILLGFFLLAYAAGWVIYDYQDTVDLEEDLPEVDVIVCLAGGRGRISAASELWYRYRQQAGEQGAYPVLFVSGMGKGAKWDIFSKQVDSKILALLREEDVILENLSSNTLENAEVFATAARQEDWTKVLLVTATYHMRRAVYLFNKSLNDPEITIETLSVYQSPFSANEWKKSFNGIRVTLFEFIKWVFYRTYP